MVALAVVLTRYQPGIESVIYKDTTRQKLTNKWLKRICCERSDDAVGDGAYQQVQTSSDEQEFPDEGKYARMRSANIQNVIWLS